MPAQTDIPPFSVTDGKVSNQAKINPSKLAPAKEGQVLIAGKDGKFAAGDLPKTVVTASGEVDELLPPNSVKIGPSAVDGTSNRTKEVGTSANAIPQRDSQGNLHATTADSATYATYLPYTGLTGTVPTWNQNTTGTALNITGIAAITNGGTGANSASGARTNLGLVIGTNVQAYDSDLTALAALNAHNGKFIVGTGSAWVTESGATARASLDVDQAGTDNSTNVTLAGSYDYITAGGTGNQTLTLGQVNLTTDVTGALPDANISSAATWNAMLPKAGGTLTGALALSTNTTPSTSGGEAFLYKHASNGTVLSGYTASIETGSAGSRSVKMTVSSAGTVTVNNNLTVAGSCTFAALSGTTATFSGDLTVGGSITRSSGTLNINGSSLALNNAGATKTYLLGTDGGSVQLRYNDITKFETSSGGATLSGTLTIGGTIASTSDFTIDANGGIILDADNGAISLTESGTNFGIFQNSNSNFFIQNPRNNKDIVFKINDGGTVKTALTLNGATNTSTFAGSIFAQTIVAAGAITTALGITSANGVQVSSGSSVFGAAVTIQGALTAVAATLTGALSGTSATFSGAITAGSITSATVDGGAF